MRKGLVIGLAATAVAGALSSLLPVGVSAGPLEREPQAAPAAGLSAGRIAASVRAMGLAPDGAPLLRGRYYVLRAVDARGAELRVLADADDGEILSVLPARPAPVERPAASGAQPRIIQVPQADEFEANDTYQDSGGAGNADAIGPAVAPPPPRRRSEAPPVERHVVTSAPPPPMAASKDQDTALTPVYPTPDFSAKTGNAGAKPGPAPFDRLPPPQSTAAPR